MKLSLAQLSSACQIIALFLLYHAVLSLCGSGGWWFPSDYLVSTQHKFSLFFVVVVVVWGYERIFEIVNQEYVRFIDFSLWNVCRKIRCVYLIKVWVGLVKPIKRPHGNRYRYLTSLSSRFLISGELWAWSASYLKIWNILVSDVDVDH